MPEQVRFGLVSLSQGRAGQVRLVKPPTKVVPTTEVSSNEVIPRPPSYFFLHRSTQTTQEREICLVERASILFGKKKEKKKKGDEICSSEQNVSMLCALV